MAARNKRVLVAGLVCLDIINVCDQYPQEDQDKRAISQHWQRGGNAANQSDVLSQLGSTVEFFGPISTSHGAEFAVNTLRSKGVECGNCIVYKNCHFPTSCVTLSNETGSRTIVHYRGSLPELSVTDFKKLDLERYDWIEFEARRNVQDILAMIDIVDTYNNSKQYINKITVSVEIEKKTECHKELMPKADVIFISKDFAEFNGYSSAGDAVRGLYPTLKPGATLICPWASLGAEAMGPNKVLVHSHAFSPKTLRDTLGAGDTFIAAVIQSFCDGQTLQDSLTLGCKLAGYKCGIQGYNGLGEYWKVITK